MNEDDLKNFLNTRKDWNKLSNENRANILVLSFIGYVVRPKNIPKETLEKCVKVNNNNRGKTETEVDAVLKVLEKE